MSFRKPCHMPFRKLIPPFTLTATSDEVKTRMFTFLHDIAKPLAENSKMHQQPAAVRPTKIILRLLAVNLSTTANQLSATSVLIQQK